MNKKQEQERLQSVSRAEHHYNLARYIGNYINDNTDDTKSMIGIIYDAIGKFHYGE